jgi:mRNA interferase HigB
MTFRTADVVGSQTIFNIGGNKYRLIALVNYRLGIVLVQHVLTHAEYDREDWKQ